jgi:hypothetical protein
MFLHHPDGFIAIGELHYPLTEFLIDEPAYALPEGLIGRFYEPGVQHWLTDGSMQHAGPLPWAEGDNYLAKEAGYRAAFEARHAPAAPSLEERKASATRAVDDEAERRRLTYLTPGSGQALVYQEKRREAEAALAAFSEAGGQPVDPAEFPLLAAELGITASDLQGVAQAVMSTALAWTQVAAAIEGTRLKAKRDIDAATSAAQVEAILAAITWGA